MHKYYEKELPEGYIATKTIDAKNTKFAIVMNALAIVICIGVVFITYVMIQPENIGEQLLDAILSLQYWIFLLSMIGYIILHELVHGIAYKVLTKQKLTFGLTWSAAYCGVPHIYTYRKTSLIALLAPFVVFNIVFIGAMFFLKSDMSLMFCSVLLGLHIGGCVGDLYDTYLLLFQYKNDSTLINDNGPKQVIYVKQEDQLFIKE